MTEKNYIADMRALVGHQGMIFVTAFGVLWSADRQKSCWNVGQILPILVGVFLAVF
jgi:hypothetical protein